MPQDIWDAEIVTLYKNKGEQSECSNYRAFSLLSIVGKVFVLGAIRCPPKLLSMIRSFHDGMKSIVYFDSDTSAPFEILSVVK